MEYHKFTLTEDFMKPTTEILKSIAESPKPKDLTGVWSWHGLVNKVGHFHAIMAPLRDLLRSKDNFQWNKRHSAAFEASRQAVKEGITSISPKKDTILAIALRRTGMGFHLSQKLCRCQEVKPNCCKN